MDEHESTLAERLQAVLNAKRVKSMKAWSDAAGLASGHVGLIIRGTVKGDVRVETLKALATAAGISYDWLSTGRGSMLESESDTAPRNDIERVVGESPFDQALGEAFDRTRHTMGDVRNVERSLASIPRMMIDGSDPVALVREWLDAAARLRRAGVPYSDVALAAEVTGERKMDAAQRARHEQRIADLNAEGDAELARLRGEEPKPSK